MLSMVFIVFIEELAKRGLDNFSQWDEFTPMDDYRLYVFVTILNPILFFLVILRGYLTYTREFIALLFALLVATFDLFLIGRLLADVLYLKRRVQLPA